MDDLRILAWFFSGALSLLQLFRCNTKKGMMHYALGARPLPWRQVILSPIYKYDTCATLG